MLSKHCSPWCHKSSLDSTICWETSTQPICDQQVRLASPSFWTAASWALGNWSSALLRSMRAMTSSFATCTVSETSSGFISTSIPWWTSASRQKSSKKSLLSAMKSTWISSSQLWEFLLRTVSLRIQVLESCRFGALMRWHLWDARARRCLTSVQSLTGRCQCTLRACLKSRIRSFKSSPLSRRAECSKYKISLYKTKSSWRLIAKRTTLNQNRINYQRWASQSLIGFEMNYVWYFVENSLTLSRWDALDDFNVALCIWCNLLNETREPYLNWFVYCHINGNVHRVKHLIVEREDVDSNNSALWFWQAYIELNQTIIDATRFVHPVWVDEYKCFSCEIRVQLCQNAIVERGNDF